MTKKDIIYETLSQIAPIAYRMTDLTELPRFSFSLVSHWSDRLSNTRHHQNTVYQIDYFSDEPLDVEEDPVLWQVIHDLEAQRLVLTDWQEVTDIDVDASTILHQYWIEVR